MSNFGPIKNICIIPINRTAKQIEREKKAEQRQIERNFREQQRRIKKLTNSAFSQQQITQISNACELVQDAININNSTLAELNTDLASKAINIGQ